MAEKQKIIQKRVQRRERYARMARIRYRKQKNVMLAKPEVLADISKCNDDFTLVHQYSPGIFFGERNGSVDCEVSMLNKDYIINNISVVKEGDAKLLRIKLYKGSEQQCASPKVEELESWKKRKHPSWGEWAERFSKFSDTYKKFLAKHQEIFETGNIDQELIQKYNIYDQKRKEIMSSRSVLEIKTRFNLTEDYVSELTYTSQYVNGLGYEFDEFVDKILREGLPRIKVTECDDGFLMRKVVENFEEMFEKPLEFHGNWLPGFMGNNNQIFTGNVSFVVAGYFIKNKAELSYLVIYDDVKPLEENRISFESIHMPVVKKEIIENIEGKMFLEKYYKDQCPCLRSQDLFKEAQKTSSEASAPLSTKVESEDMGIKEEISEENRNNAQNVNTNNCCAFNSQNNLNESLILKDNIILAQPQDGWNNSLPAEMLLGLYNKQREMQKYMFLCQNNLFNYMNN